MRNISVCDGCEMLRLYGSQSDHDFSVRTVPVCMASGTGMVRANTRPYDAKGVKPASALAEFRNWELPARCVRREEQESMTRLREL